MDDNLAIFLLLLVSIGAAVVLTALSAWLRAGRRDRAALAADGGAAEIALLQNENGELKGQIGRLEDRLRVLERIATDPAERTAREIEHLR